MASIAQFTCPISLSIPVEPVVAADGFIYERESLESHIDSVPLELRCRGRIRSPMTNADMGSQFLPCRWFTSAVEGMIDSGHLVGDLVVEYQSRKELFRLKTKVETSERIGNDDSFPAERRFEELFYSGKMRLSKSSPSFVRCEEIGVKNLMCCYRLLMERLVVRPSSVVIEICMRLAKTRGSLLFICAGGDTNLACDPTYFLVVASKMGSTKAKGLLDKMVGSSPNIPLVVDCVEFADVESSDDES